MKRRSRKRLLFFSGSFQVGKLLWLQEDEERRERVVEKHYRHELKFSISYSEYIAMRKRLQNIMSSDPHTDSEGLYQIRSIYFDNSDDKALREKIDGIQKREKFRIRYYNDDFSFITLEKKMKINELCLKYDARITESQFA